MYRFIWTGMMGLVLLFGGCYLSYRDFSKNDDNADGQRNSGGSGKSVGGSGSEDSAGRGGSMEDSHVSEATGGITSSTPECGNGVKEKGEQCDGEQLARQSCRSLGYTGGILSCESSTCKFDVSSCAICGDSTIQIGENCEKDDLQGKTCKKLGLGSGTLVCDPSVCLFDTSQCGSSSGPLCGNGIAERGEECDGEDVLGSSCESLGFGRGKLRCNAETCRFNTSRCSVNDPAKDISSDLTCSECREKYCGKAIKNCQDDPNCTSGIECFKEKCGVDVSTSCTMSCFNGNVPSIQTAITLMACAFTLCDAYCIGPL